MASYNLCVSLLLVLFGSSTWLGINGIWMELSIYALELPEAWNLPNWLATFVELACIFPFLYGLFRARIRLAHKSVPILAILFSSSTCLLLLSLSWHKTVWLFASARSLPLIGLTFVLALGSALSNVLFLPYLAQFPAHYLPVYFVGMSLSDSVPSFLKLAQGAGDFECVSQILPNGTSILVPLLLPPRFPVATYNLALFGWMCLATFAFVLLHFRFRKLVANVDLGMRRAVASQCPSPVPSSSSSSPTLAKGRLRFWVQAASIGLVSALMNNVMPSVLSFATLPYSLLTYHLSLTLSNLSHTLANLLALWAHPRHFRLLLPILALSTLAAVYIFVLALQSPEPLLRHSMPAVGTFLAVSASVLVGFLSSFLRAQLVFLVREENWQESERYLFLCGIFMQIGSFSGAIFMFLLVNVLQIFKERSPCT